MRTVALLTLGIAMLALIACSDESKAMPVDLNTDGTFVATAVPWRKGQAPIAQVVVRVENKQISVDADCNEYTTMAIRIDDGRLLNDDLFIGTDVGCSGTKQEQDEWLLDLLNSKPLISITSERFDLRSDDATLTALSSSPVPR